MRRYCGIMVILILHLRDALGNPDQLIYPRLRYLRCARIMFVPVCIGVASGANIFVI